MIPLLRKAIKGAFEFAKIGLCMERLNVQSGKQEPEKGGLVDGRQHLLAEDLRGRKGSSLAFSDTSLWDMVGKKGHNSHSIRLFNDR